MDFTTICIINAIFWAIVCALIGSNKGAATFGFFMGALFGPIGLIIILVWRVNNVK